MSYVMRKADDAMGALQADEALRSTLEAVIASVVEDCAREVESVNPLALAIRRAAARVRSLLSPDTKGQP